MGFNPRIQPKTVSRHFRLHFETGSDTNSLHRPFFKFPFAGQILAVYGNAERFATGAVNTAVEATTNTGIDEISIWKHATDDTTATYATSLRSLQRTGAQDSSTGGGINWRLPGTSGEDTMYAFSNNNTSSAARKQYAAGDVAMVHVRNYGATDTSRIFHINLQMDYIIGYEDA